MNCKRCGKALGTDRGICPFCGAMLTQEQLNQFKEDKMEKMLQAELLTEKYGAKPIHYEKNESGDSKLLLGILLVLGVIVIIAVIVLIVVLNQ